MPWNKTLPWGEQKWIQQCKLWFDWNQYQAFRTRKVQSKREQGRNKIRQPGLPPANHWQQRDQARARLKRGLFFFIFISPLPVFPGNFGQDWAEPEAPETPGSAGVMAMYQVNLLYSCAVLTRVAQSSRPYGSYGSYGVDKIYSSRKMIVLPVTAIFLQEYVIL